jgi:Mg2+ and Co2+ transporter CorA
MGVQERAKRKKEVYAFGMLKANEETIKDQAKLIKELRETILAYSERVNMYEVKVGKLRRTISEYINERKNER